MAGRCLKDMGASKAMGRVVKCPRCQANLEVGNMAPGSSVRCTECGGMARIPSGRTGVNPAVKAPVAAPPPTAPRKETGTRTRLRPVSSTGLKPVPRMQRKKSKTGLVVGLIAGVFVVGIVLALVLTGNRNAPLPETAPKTSRPKSPKPDSGGGGSSMGFPGMPATPVPVVTPVPGVPVHVPVPVGRVEDPQKARWDELMTALRAGGAFDELSRPEGVAYKRVKEMGKGAYPHLVKYIDHEDVMLGRAAVSVLNSLTEQKKPLPNDSTKAKVKAEWEEWVKANP